MRHCFIINPAAGKTSMVTRLTEQIEKAFEGREDAFEIHVTTGNRDATEHAYRLCREVEGPLRIYACGGDGTLNELIEPAMSRPDVAIGAIPYGTGNDYVKNFGRIPYFRIVEAQIDAPARPVDIIKVDEDRYSINILNIGFDSRVSTSVTSFKRLPFINGTMAYIMSVAKCLLGTLADRFTVTIDGETLEPADYLLVSIANGFCYGGAFQPTPLAKVDDGIIDVCLVKKVSIPRFVRLVGAYTRGEHIELEEAKDVILYRKCKHIVVESDTEFYAGVDGENYKTTRVQARILEHAVQFIDPVPLDDHREEGTRCEIAKLAAK